MPLPVTIKKAKLMEIEWLKDHPVKDGAKEVDVQFNPQSLSVSFANQLTGGSTETSKQYVGKGTSTLTLDLWFDVTAPGTEVSKKYTDVREMTEQVVYFITPKLVGKDTYIPPGVRFLWGTFLFEGIITSIKEDLDYFSPEGKPLRAKINLSITQQEIQFDIEKGGAGASSGLGAGLSGGLGIGLSGGIGLGISGGIGIGAGISGGISAGIGVSAGIGTQPLMQAEAGASIQAMAGGSTDWKKIALANNIENPRVLTPGVMVNANVSANIKVE